MGELYEQFLTFGTIAVSNHPLIVYPSLLSFLVDDDLDDQEVFAIAMQEVHPEMNFEFAKDGLHAIEKFQGNPGFCPDIIFLDINMPRMNGIECLAEIRKIPRLHHTPVYMYSTSAEPDFVNQCLNMGASGFIQKISDLDELQKVFKRIINRVL